MPNIVSSAAKTAALVAPVERTKSWPADVAASTHFRVRRNRVDQTTNVTLRYDAEPKKWRRWCVVSPHRRHLCQDIRDTDVSESSRGQGPVSGRGACAGGTFGQRACGCARVHRSWIHKLLARYREGGLEALEPRSKRPRSCSHETPAALVAAIVALRGELEGQGHDAGAETIAYHLAQRHEQIPSVSTIWRILRREGLVVPQRQKRPRCSLIRFEAQLPNACWQADITAWTRPRARWSRSST